MAEVMKAIPFTQFSMEMRSGKIIDIDDGFTELLGYTEDDFADLHIALINNFTERNYNNG